MILLELGFEYDTTSRVILTQHDLSGDLHVLGIWAPSVSINGANGGMVREFYEHAKQPVRTNNVEDFRVNLGMAFRVALHGGGLDPIWDAWLSNINPDIEGCVSGHPAIKRGTSIRFYHPHGPEGSWVWKDTVKTITAIMKP